MQTSGFGPGAAVFHALFIVVNLVIIVAAIQMMRRRWYAFAVVGAILSMVDLGTFCCVLGLPFGIWSLIVLLLPDVREAFE
jgi:hypothetical protein